VGSITAPLRPSSGLLFYQPDLLLFKCAKNSVRYRYSDTLVAELYYSPVAKSQHQQGRGQLLRAEGLLTRRGFGSLAREPTLLWNHVQHSGETLATNGCNLST